MLYMVFIAFIQILIFLMKKVTSFSYLSHNTLQVDVTKNIYRWNGDRLRSNFMQYVVTVVNLKLDVYITHCQLSIYIKKQKVVTMSHGYNKEFNIPYKLVFQFKKKIMLFYNISISFIFLLYFAIYYSNISYIKSRRS